MQHIYEDNFTNHCQNSILSPIGYMTLFLLVETIVLFGIDGVYICMYIN